MPAKLNLDRETLYRLYVTEQKPMHQIAKDLCCSVGAVHKYVKRYEIPTREQHKGFRGKTHSAESRAKIGKRHKGKIVTEETRNKLAEAKTQKGIGHKKKRSDGYLYIYFPDHPKCTKEGYVMEHDLVMECLIGRHLLDNEVVHHKNHIRDDNRKENLQLMTVNEHARLHWAERREKMKGGMTY